MTRDSILHLRHLYTLRYTPGRSSPSPVPQQQARVSLPSPLPLSHAVLSSSAACIFGTTISSSGFHFMALSASGKSDSTIGSSRLKSTSYWAEVIAANIVITYRGMRERMARELEFMRKWIEQGHSELIRESTIDLHIQFCDAPASTSTRRA